MGTVIKWIWKERQVQTGGCRYRMKPVSYGGEYEILMEHTQGQKYGGVHCLLRGYPGA